MDLVIGKKAKNKIKKNQPLKKRYLLIKKKLVAALACRNMARLYGKPIQNLDVYNRYKIIDYIIDSLEMIECIDEIILGINNGIENKIL